MQTSESEVVEVTVTAKGGEPLTVQVTVLEMGGTWIASRMDPQGRMITRQSGSRELAAMNCATGER